MPEFITMNRRQLESEIEQKHRDIARAAGWFVVKIEKASLNGFPDRFYAQAGRVVLLEFKRPGGVMSAQQKLRHRELCAAGVEFYVVYSVAEANRVLGIPDTVDRIHDLENERRRNPDTGSDDL